VDVTAESDKLGEEDQELLLEVLEMRENIEEVEEESDLEPLREENTESIESSRRVLEQAFEKDDLDTARKEAVRLRYWFNIKESLDAWEKGKPVANLVH
jgi:molecular chaperone HscB